MVRRPGQRQGRADRPRLGAGHAGGGGDRHDPVDLVASANKLMWVIEAGSGDLDCITPLTGAVTSKPSGLVHPDAIARANDDALWYVDTAANKIARLAQPADCTAAIAPAIFDLPPGSVPTRCDRGADRQRRLHRHRPPAYGP